MGTVIGEHIFQVARLEQMNDTKRISRNISTIEKKNHWVA